MKELLTVEKNQEVPNEIDEFKEDLLQEEFYKNPHHINVHLTSSAQSIQDFTDDLLSEISQIKEIKTGRPRYRECLKKIILNLIVVRFSNGCIRYSRNKNDYIYSPDKKKKKKSHKKKNDSRSRGYRYGLLWFSHRKTTHIVDALVELGYVKHLKGIRAKNLQSKMWSSAKFWQKLDEYLQGQAIDFIEREAPEQLIQVKNKDKRLVQYTETRAITKARNFLKAYNRFITEQDINVALPQMVKLKKRFLVETLLQGLLNGTYKIDTINLNQELELNNTISNSSTISSISSTPFSTFTSNLQLSQEYSSIFNPKLSSTQQYPYTTDINTNLHIPSSNKAILVKPLVYGLLTLHKDYVANWFLNELVDTVQAVRELEYQDFLDLMNEVQSLEDMGIQDLCFRLNYECLHRVFNKSSVKYGGRFYGASHIGLPQHIRSFIHIDGKPTVELDYDFLHIKMLYNRRGLDVIEDPYSRVEGPEERGIKKKVLLTAINAKTDKDAIKGIRYEFVKEGHWDFLKTEYIADILARAKDAHPDISKDIASGKGLKLQSIDSKIAYAVLENLMKQDIPALPVHDSFIVPKQYEDELRHQMITEYEKALGYRPGVSTKSKRYGYEKSEVLM